MGQENGVKTSTKHDKATQQTSQTKTQQNVGKYEKVRGVIVGCAYTNTTPGKVETAVKTPEIFI